MYGTVCLASPSIVYRLHTREDSVFLSYPSTRIASLHSDPQSRACSVMSTDFKRITGSKQRRAPLIRYWKPDRSDTGERDWALEAHDEEDWQQEEELDEWQQERETIKNEKVGNFANGMAGKEKVEFGRSKGPSDIINGYGGQMRKTRSHLPAHVDRITSVGNAFVKHVVKLRRNSLYRHACGCVVVVGDVPLREICDVMAVHSGIGDREHFIDFLFLLEHVKASAAIVESARRVVWVTSSVMHKLSGVDTAGGVEAVGIIPFPHLFCNLDQMGSWLSVLNKWCPSPQRLLVLDMIQDPGNLGTLLRTAAAFSWDGVFLMNNCCDPFNEKALRASRGACFRIPIAIGLWSQLQAFAETQQMKLFAGEPEHDNCFYLATRSPANHQQIHGNDILVRSKQSAGEMESHRKHIGLGSALQRLASMADEEAMCLVLGSEGKGLSEHVRQSCKLISIPMPGSFESLNVAVAGGILLFALQNDWSRNY